jgi:alpha-L-fucosidase
MLTRCAQGNGNLLFNVGPTPDGIVPEPCVRVLHRVGEWLRKNGEAIYGTELFTFSLQERGDHRGDWNLHGPMTVKGNSLFWLLRRSPRDKATLGGLQNKVLSVSRLDNGEALPFTQSATRVQITNVPATDETGLWPALKIECDGAPVVYQTGGLRIPKAPHPHYDPCPSDIAH